MTSIRGKIACRLMRRLMYNKPIYKRGGMVYFGLISAKRSFFIKPIGYTLEKYNVDNIPVEKLIKNDSKNKDKVIFQIHGGAYLIPLVDLFRNLSVKFSKLSDYATVFNVDYRVAPENKFPAARDDVEKVYFDILKQGYKPENIILSGDSAGANLILSLTCKLRDEHKPLPKAIICMSPWADLACGGQSYYDNLYLDDEFGITPKMNLHAHKFHLINSFIKPYAGDTKLTNKELSPVYNDYHDYPPILIQVGSHEMLLSDSITIFEKCRKADVDATLTMYDGMFHTFQTLVNVPESKKAWKEVSQFINKHFYLKNKKEHD